jgi:hypothetical protein
MLEILDPFDDDETVQAELRAAVIADGGLEGLFNKLRSDQTWSIMDRYNLLLGAVSGNDDDKHRQKQPEASDALSIEQIDRYHLEITSIPGITGEDVPAMLIASILCRIAFPDLHPAQIPLE